MINRALKIIRLYHQLSQIELANLINISNSYLSEIESGKKTPTIELLNKYSNFFKIPTSSILFFSEKIDKNYNDKVSNYVANKVLKILEWLSDSNVYKKEINHG